jgi:glucuronosyltransferase
MTFGSYAKTSGFSIDQTNAIFKTFSNLKQRIIMKWEDTNLGNKNENILISKWLPQDDILAHSKIKLFISHCGLGGIMEAKFHGVPMVCVPLVGDQPNNARKISHEGWSSTLNLNDLTEETLSAAINEVLTNPKYAQTVQLLSLLIRDRPMSALDTAVYWTEYVLRHHGAPHLHYPGADLNFFQYNSIDVILFLIVVVYLTVKIFKLFCKSLFCKRRQELKFKLN